MFLDSSGLTTWSFGSAFLMVGKAPSMRWVLVILKSIHQA